MDNENQRIEHYKGGQFVLKFRPSLNVNEVDYAQQHWADALRLYGDNGCALRNYPDVVMSASVPDDCNEDESQVIYVMKRPQGYPKSKEVCLGMFVPMLIPIGTGNKEYLLVPCFLNALTSCETGYDCDAPSAIRMDIEKLHYAVNDSELFEVVKKSYKTLGMYFK